MTREQQLENALVDLVLKLEEIKDHPSYQAVFTHASIHNMNYKGPNWQDEVNKAKRLLEMN